MADPDHELSMCLDQLRADIGATGRRLDRVHRRFEGTGSSVTGAPKGLIGRRVMVERAFASLHKQLATLESRVEALELGRTGPGSTI